MSYRCVAERGQALLELAICLPVLLALALGSAALARLADARSGLDAATQAALATAARAPDPASAADVARSQFAKVIAGYPVSGPVLTLELGPFARGELITARSRGEVDLAWALPPIPVRIRLGSHALAELQPWRSR
ncbi:MAG: TadE/TadG family type IV pilus assembly protein [Candidatus Dormibacteraceae bacterium]